MIQLIWNEGEKNSYLKAKFIKENYSEQIRDLFKGRKSELLILAFE